MATSGFKLNRLAGVVFAGVLGCSSGVSAQAQLLGHVVGEVIVRSAIAGMAPADKTLPSTVRVEGCARFFVGGAEPASLVKQKMAGNALSFGGKKSLCFDGFALVYSGGVKAPLYVAQVLTADNLGAEEEGGAQLEEYTKLQEHMAFNEEQKLLSGKRRTLADFENSGYRPWSLFDAKATRNSSVRKQGQSLVAAIPLPLDSSAQKVATAVNMQVREYVRAHEGAKVFTLTGALFEKDVKTGTGTGSFAVPSGMFKAVYDETSKKGWAFVWDVQRGVEREQGLGSGYASSVPAPISLKELTQRTGVYWMPRAEEVVAK